MMDKRKAPSYMGGGGTESKLKEFDLQRFATVSNPYTAELEEKLLISSFIDIQITLVDLSFYAMTSIASYQTVTEIPQENIEYLSSGLVASSCGAMFYGCESLTSIPWNDFNIDTSQCTNMRYMFYNCRTLTSLNISNFDTSQVTNMYRMFDHCYVLTNLNLSNFDTSKVTDMNYMFSECNSLTDLNLSNFDTSQVTDMSSMFIGCSALASLDLSNFDTSKVTDMSDMFNSCKSLQEIICPNGFDLSSCTEVSRMFHNCNPSYSGEPLHFKNVLRNLNFSGIYGTEGKHYVIDNYKD